MRGPTDPEFKRALPWVGPFAELTEAPARHVSQSLRSIRTVPVPDEPSAVLIIAPAKAERGKLAMTALFMAPGNSSRNQRFASASLMVRDAVTGQAEMPAEGAEPIACRTGATSVPGTGLIALKSPNNLLLAAAGMLGWKLISARRAVAAVGEVIQPLAAAAVAHGEIVRDMAAPCRSGAAALQSQVRITPFRSMGDAIKDHFAVRMDGKSATRLERQ